MPKIASQVKHTHTTETEKIMPLERTALINETWKANEPTVRDLLAIEREERNQLIIDILTEFDELGA